MLCRCRAEESKPFGVIADVAGIDVAAQIKLFGSKLRHALPLLPCLGFDICLLERDKRLLLNLDIRIVNSMQVHANPDRGLKLVLDSSQSDRMIRL